MTNKKRPDAADEHVSRRVQQRRREVGMSQEKLGEHIDVTFQQIQKYEKGSNRISAGRLLRISEVLNTEIAYFYAGFSQGEDAPSGFSHGEQAPFEGPPSDDEHKRLLDSFDKLTHRELREAVIELIRALGHSGKRND